MSRTSPVWRRQTNSPSPRTWVGVARVGRDTTNVEGVMAPWTGHHDSARMLLVAENGPHSWLTLTRDEMDSAGGVDRAVRQALLGPGPDVRTAVTPTDVDIPVGDITVVVCTHDRPSTLDLCLERLGEAIGDGAKILVVDNAPSSDAAEKVIDRRRAAGLPVCRLLEPQKGLSRSRNLAMRVVDSEYVAFIDDDVIVDANWLTWIRQGFGRGENVALVCGLVAAAELESRAQQQFERTMGWGEDLQPEVYSLAERGRYSWPFPYSAGYLGTGANIAVRRKDILSLGGFDEALGPGTRSRGGEDLELFIRVIRSGRQIVRQPGAIAWHQHRREENALRRQLFGYGTGAAAQFTSLLLQPGRWDLATSLFHGCRSYTKSQLQDLDSGKPKSYLAFEVAGLAYGAFAYAAERMTQRRQQLTRS